MQALYIYSTDPQYLRKPSTSSQTNGTTSSPVRSALSPRVWVKSRTHASLTVLGPAAHSLNSLGHRLRTNHSADRQNPVRPTPPLPPPPPPPPTRPTPR